MVWDEENRLRGINDNGRLHLYTYDHTGERALKSSAESSMAVINEATSAIITHTEGYTAYVSPYFVVQKGKFTKHYFEGSSRVVSKLGEGTFVHKNTGIMAGGLDYLKRTQKEQEARDKYIKGLQVPPGPPTQHGIYASPEWTGEAYPSISWSDISQNTEPPTGWSRYPRFNEPGDVPGPPVQFGEAITNTNVKAGYGFIPNGVEEKNLYFYHPDHLGSSSYITNKDGEIIQHTEYMAFGETFVDEHSVSNKQPYLFNGKELDFETGLYYYGARYYDPKVSIFLNVDPLAEKTGTPYTYTYNNPIRFIDPTGMEAEEGPGNPRRVTIYKHTVVWNDQAKKYAVYRVGETTGTRVEGIDWKGAEEYHYTVFVKGTNKTRMFSDNESFQKSFPNNFNHDAYKAELEGYDNVNLVFTLGGDAFGLGGLKSKTLGKLSGHLQVAGLLTSGLKITAALKYNDKQTAKEEFKNTTVGWVVDKGLDKFNTVKDGVGEIFKIGKNQIQQVLQNDKDRAEEKRIQKYKR